MALDTIPKQEGGKLKAVASGTLPSGKPVVVNADGTVSVISSSSTSESAGSDTVFTSGITPNSTAAVYDTNSNKVVVFVATTGTGYAYVGTVSGTSINFTSGTNFESGSATFVKAAYDPVSGKILVLWQTASLFKARMATVSGSSISYGSIVTVDADKLEESAIAYDTVNQKFVIAYTDWTNNNRYGTAIIGTVSGTSISFGTPVIFRSARTDATFACVYDVSSGKTVIAYSEVAGSNNINAIVGTISGTSISFGSAVTVSTTGSYTTGVYDSASQKTVIFYKNSTGRARVGTVSGTSISFGTEAVFGTNPAYISTVYDTTAQKIVVSYQENFATTEMQSAKVSGTDITFDSPLEVSNSVYTDALSSAYDPDTGKVILTYKDNGNSNNGTYFVYQAGYTSTNLTSENYIGISGGVVNSETVTQALGSVVDITNTQPEYFALAFDETAGKVVVAYKLGSAPEHGYAAVGTVSGTSITFGTPVAYTSSALQSASQSIAYDAVNNKVVISFTLQGGGNRYGTAIVGTVSGTSISFGSAVTFNAGVTAWITSVFDSSSNKVVISYSDGGNSNYGTAIVGTVSGTSISFGTGVVFESAEANYSGSAFDSVNNKVVLSYRDNGNSGKGTAIVGTVSGTSISFGTAALFNNASTYWTNATFDSTNGKAVVVYNDDGNSNYGTAVVGTVSGTNISFGSEVVFQTSSTQAPVAVFDSSVGKVTVAYRNSGNSNNTTIVPATVSGTSISFDTAVDVGVVNGGGESIGIVFDSTNNKIVTTFKDDTANDNSAVVFQNAGTITTRGQVASGGAATVDIVGTVSTNQSGLTAGQQYFVQTDGTIGETPADPSVLAGTAISATKMLVKT